MKLLAEAAPGAVEQNVLGWRDETSASREQERRGIACLAQNDRGGKRSGCCFVL